MEYKDTTFTYKLLCRLGFHYPIDDYGDVSIIKVIKQVFINFWHRLLINMMDWAILEPFAPRKLRPLFARLLGAKVGKDVFIGEYVTFDINHSNLITIEDGVHIAGGAHLLCHKKDLSEYGEGKVYGNMPYKYGEIHLCKNCAIGTKSLVMSGVTVGEGAIVGAFSLVTKDIPAWSLAVGSPAKVIKQFPHTSGEDSSIQKSTH